MSEYKMMDERELSHILETVETASGPLSRTDLLEESKYDSPTEMQPVVRELLYTGRLTTTPDWRYDLSDDR